MMNVKIGLKVICINVGIYSVYLTIGKTYEIVEYDTFAAAIRVFSNDGRARWYDVEQFDCVTLRRVEVINNILL